MEKIELGKENITNEFMLAELFEQAAQDESWEDDPQKRVIYSDNFFFYIKSFL
jgi:hypothetical protein